MVRKLLIFERRGHNECPLSYIYATLAALTSYISFHTVSLKTYLNSFVRQGVYYRFS